MAFQWVEILTLLLVPSHELERTTIRYERGRILFEDSASNSYSAETVHDSIYDFNAQWDDSWPLANCFFPEDPSLVIQAIVNDTAVMVSDGSYKRREVNPYCCSEVQGCHAGLLGLLAFAIFHQVHSGAVAFHFNNDAGLNQSAASHLNVAMKLKHGDLIQAI